MSSGVEKNTSSTSRVWSSSCVVKNSKNKQSSSPTFFIQCNVFFGKKITCPAVTLYVVTVLASASTTPIQAVPWNIDGARELSERNDHGCSQLINHIHLYTNLFLGWFMQKWPNLQQEAGIYDLLRYLLALSFYDSTCIQYATKSNTHDWL